MTIPATHAEIEQIYLQSEQKEGPIDLPELAERQIEARLAGRTLSVDCVDKFPKMVDYVVPTGVRIADTSRVRLGAHVGEGTTVMHEGFINFNAGTTGVSMVEGRISAGVVVGNGSDIGGGASIMGTLSGGGKVVVSIGENSLLGANAGLGFPMGDRCTIESLRLETRQGHRLFPVVSFAFLAIQWRLLLIRS